jgi:anti-sigma factor RsiW
MPPDDCPAPAALAAFHAGDLPPADIDRVAAHLEGCPACEAVLQRLDGRTGPVADAVRTPPRPPSRRRTNGPAGP